MSVKKRLIFEILYDSGNVCISRNYRLQKMGTIDWFKNAFDLFDLTKHIDELTVINLSKSDEYDFDFQKFVSTISSSCYAPITLGGRVEDVAGAKKFLDMGADKIVVNRNFFSKKAEMIEIVQYFGQQFMVVSIDFATKNGSVNAFVNQGKVLIGELSELPIDFINTTAGEVILRSIDQDGTGNGLDVSILSNPLINELKIPIVLSGGAGKPSHIVDAIKASNVSGVATSNLINFIGDGLMQTRHEMEIAGIEIPKFIPWELCL